MDRDPPLSATHPRGAGAQRLVVLWLCWIMMGVFLVAAGVIGAVPSVRGLGPPDASHASNAGRTIAPGEFASVGRTARDRASEGAAAPAARDASRGPLARVEVHLPESRERLVVRYVVGARANDYAGPVRVLVGDEVRFDGDVTPGQVLEVAVPIACDSFVVCAPGFEPADCEPSRTDGRRFVDLVPTARIEFEVHGADPATIGEAHVSIVCGDGSAGAVAAEFDARGVLRAVAPVPIGRTVEWQLGCDGEAVAMHTGSHRALREGETGRVSVVLEARPWRLVGPSDELLPHIDLFLLWAARGQRVRPAAGGAFSVSGDEPRRASIRAHPGFGARIDRTSVPTVVRPERELVGVGLVDERDDWLLTRLLGDDGSFHSMPQRVHVFVRDELPEHLFVAAGERRVRLEPRIATGGSDLLRLRAVEPPTGTLVVRLVGEPTAVRDDVTRSLVVTGDAIVSRRTEPLAAEVRLQLPAAANYQLALEAHGVGFARSVAFASDVAIVAGSTTERAVHWPEVTLWRGRVDGEADVPDGFRHSSITWGARSRFGGIGGCVAQDRTFELLLLDEPLPAAAPTLWMGQQGIEARVVERDERSRTLVVRPTAQLRAVQVVVVGADDWRIVTGLSRGGTWRPFGPQCSSDRPEPLVLHEGQVVHGALVAVEAGAPRVLSWLTVRGTDRELRVAPSGARTLQVSNPSPDAEIGFGLVGPNGQIRDGATVQPGQVLPFCVPDDTRALCILRDGELLEIPLRDGDRVELR